MQFSRQIFTDGVCPCGALIHTALEVAKTWLASHQRMTHQVSARARARVRVCACVCVCVAHQWGASTSQRKILTSTSCTA
eukprot:1729783-Pyramimonas_sp.AAC.1